LLVPDELIATADGAVREPAASASTV